MEQNKDLPPWFHLPYRKCMQFYVSYLAQAGGNPDKLRELEKHLAENDLFYLLRFVLSPGARVQKKWLFERCREVQAAPDGYLDLWAREHFKSTIITFGLTIFDIINDPEITVGIFSHTKSIARDFLGQIKTELEQNEKLKSLWPDVFYAEPAKESPRWSRDGGIVVKRQGNPKEATVEAHGLVDGQPTGRHFRLRVYDDVVTLESVATPEQIAKTTHAWRMSDNLGTEGGAVRYIGTRYHLFDTYRTMIDDETAIPRLHPATVNGLEDGEPVLLDPETLRAKRKVQGPYVFSAQMLLDPTADKAMGFKTDWLVYGDVEYQAAMRSLWRFIIVDPAGSKQRKNNDYTTFWVIGHGADGKYRVLDIVRDRLNLAGRTQTLFDLHRHWKPSLVAYEEYGMQADIEHMQLKMKDDLYEFQITPVGGPMPKPLRILRLIPHFENGWKEGMEPQSRIILPTTCHKIDYQGINHDLVKDFVEQEYTAFPVLSHDDMFDALARIVDLEAMKAIQTPSIIATPAVGLRIQEALKNAGKKGNESWVTA